MVNNNESFQNNSIIKKDEKLEINIEIGGTTLTALLENNETTHDFLKLLPVTITMKELYESEKYAELSVQLPRAGATRQGYEVGDIGYWAPGNCLVIYYRQTGEIINGLQIIGKINENIDVFEKYKGSVEVRITKSE
ncbi:cyclophilin-like fold protein [Sebaldella sp. S0638]|uniref:cyclophilin-like fold protein n=1 Tax=Sebaldella sp. S0638 TaxID=2957809 RepID=UPI00209F602B|nr:cyclophilin-like fold protein [Sebaldella sp. S0638]MCP1223150.1 cyclophilin-like fold protein [Sebaldella sp. S0638]